MAFSGTIVSAGQGRGIVTATGVATEIGKIQTLVGEAGSLDTPLTKQLDDFGRVLTLVILGMAAVMLAIGRFLHGMPFDELISATIGFAVAAIPEGLPALVTITLAIGVQQMAKRNAITRKLPAVEALGIGDDGVLRQDRDAHAQRDDGAPHRHPRRSVRGDRPRLRPDGAIEPPRTGERPVAATSPRSWRSRRSATTRTSSRTGDRWALGAGRASRPRAR